VPLSRWLRDDLKTTFEEHVLARDPFIATLVDPEPVRRLWAQHQRGTRDYSAHLWAILVLECWGRKFLR